MGVSLPSALPYGSRHVPGSEGRGMIGRLLAAAFVVLVPIGAAAQDPAPVPPITDADRDAAFPEVHGHAVHDEMWNYRVLFDQLEWQYIHGAQGLRWDNKSWVGGDLNRVWVKSEGEAVDGVLEIGRAHV